MIRSKLLFATFLIATAAPQIKVNAQSLTPFNPTKRNYAYVGKGGFNANVATISLHTTIKPDTAGGGFNSGTAVTFLNGAANDLNGVGINSQDGYMYGMEYFYGGPASAAANLFRIGANAVAERIGVIPAPTATDAGRTISLAFVNLTSGTIDSMGNYWFTGYTYTNLSSPFSASKVDFFLGKLTGYTSLTAPSTSTAAPTLSPVYYKLDISDTAFQRGLGNLLNQQAAMLAYGLSANNADGGWQDMDIDPVSKELYSYVAFPSAPTTMSTQGNPVNPYPKPNLNSYLVRIDKSVNPMKVVLINPTAPNTTPNREEDGAFFDSTGNFYIGFTDGQYAKVNTSTGALITINQSSLPLSSGNLRGDFAANTAVKTLVTGPTLPVRLTRFSAQSVSDKNEIVWESGLESGLDHYELQRSVDGISYSATTTAVAKGSNSIYNASDNKDDRAVYYRLKMSFTDGSDSYSGTLKVAGGRSTQVASVYPTIVMDGMLHISTSVKQVVVSIYRLNGETVQISAFTGNGSANLYDLPLVLTPGVYLARVSDAVSGTTISTSRVVVP